MSRISCFPVGQDGEQIDDEHRVPDPLADVVGTAGHDPRVPERRGGGHDFGEHALFHHALCEREDFGAAGVEERLKIGRCGIGRGGEIS